MRIRTLQELVDEAAIAHADAAIALTELVGDSRLEIDGEGSVVRFATTPDPVSFELQFVGSVSEQAGTWMWGWNNVNGFPEHIIELAKRIHDVGGEEGITELTTALVPVERTSPEQLLAASKAIAGRYWSTDMEAAPGVLVHMVLDGPALGVPSVERATQAVTDALTAGLVSDHLAALDAYARVTGAETLDEGTEHVLRCADGELRFSFDEHGRVERFRVRQGVPGPAANAVGEGTGDDGAGALHPGGTAHAEASPWGGPSAAPASDAWQSAGADAALPGPPEAAQAPAPDAPPWAVPELPRGLPEPHALPEPSRDPHGGPSWPEAPLPRSFEPQTPSPEPPPWATADHADAGFTSTGNGARPDVVAPDPAVRWAADLAGSDGHVVSGDDAPTVRIEKPARPAPTEPAENEHVAAGDDAPTVRLNRVGPPVAGSDRTNPDRTPGVPTASERGDAERSTPAVAPWPGHGGRATSAEQAGDAEASPPFSGAALRVGPFGGALASAPWAGERWERIPQLENLPTAPTSLESPSSRESGDGTSPDGTGPSVPTTRAPDSSGVPATDDVAAFGSPAWPTGTDPADGAATIDGDPPTQGAGVPDAVAPDARTPDAGARVDEESGPTPLPHGVTTESSPPAGRHGASPTNEARRVPDDVVFQGDGTPLDASDPAMSEHGTPRGEAPHPVGADVTASAADTASHASPHAPGPADPAHTETTAWEPPHGGAAPGGEPVGAASDVVATVPGADSSPWGVGVTRTDGVDPGTVTPPFGGSTQGHAPHHVDDRRPAPSDGASPRPQDPTHPQPAAAEHLASDGSRPFGVPATPPGFGRPPSAPGAPAAPAAPSWGVAPGRPGPNENRQVGGGVESDGDPHGRSTPHFPGAPQFGSPAPFPGALPFPGAPHHGGAPQFGGAPERQGAPQFGGASEPQGAPHGSVTPFGDGSPGDRAPFFGGAPRFGGAPDPQGPPPFGDGAPGDRTPFFGGAPQFGGAPDPQGPPPFPGARPSGDRQTPDAARTPGPPPFPGAPQTGDTRVPPGPPPFPGTHAFGGSSSLDGGSPQPAGQHDPGTQQFAAPPPFPAHSQPTRPGPGDGRSGGVPQQQFPGAPSMQSGPGRTEEPPRDHGPDARAVHGTPPAHGSGWPQAAADRGPRAEEPSGVPAAHADRNTGTGAPPAWPVMPTTGVPGPAGTGTPPIPSVPGFGTPPPAWATPPATGGNTDHRPAQPPQWRGEPSAGDTPSWPAPGPAPWPPTGDGRGDGRFGTPPPPRR